MPGSSLAAFEKLCAEVEQAVADGQLPASAGAAAADHRFELEKDLIRTDAEIEVLKLEAARYAGKRQAEALDQLVAAAAARERRVCVAIRQLEELGGMSAELAAAELPVAEEGSVAEGDGEGQERGFRITFEAEDLVDDPDS